MKHEIHSIKERFNRFKINHRHGIYDDLYSLAFIVASFIFIAVGFYTVIGAL